MEKLFKDRKDAGQKLAKALKKYKNIVACDSKYCLGWSMGCTSYNFLIYNMLNPSNSKVQFPQNNIAAIPDQQYCFANESQFVMI